MRSTLTYATATMLACATMALALPAHAACKQFGFTVNDYGKEGPTKDAKDLLDKHVAEWASKNGITDFKVGNKTVKCELFLDVVLFDEHTCTASANVCWGEGGATGDATEQAESDAPPPPVRKAAKKDPSGAVADKPMATPEAADAPVTIAAPADTPAPTPGADVSSATADAAAAPFSQASAGPAPAKVALDAMTMAKQAELAPAAEKTADPAPPATAFVETGALPDGKSAVPVVKADPAASKVAPQPTTKPAEAAALVDRAAAATAAAAAAQQAAFAAEKAAAAAKEAAAAALLAAREARQGPMVPALEPAPRN